MRTAWERAARRWDAVAVVALVVWLGFDLTARALFGSVAWPQSVVDYSIIHEASRHVTQTHEYPAHKPYPYPPPAVVIHAASAVFPFPAAAAIWLALTGLAALAAYVTLARVLGLYRLPGALLILPLAHVAVAYYFQWDMRSINCNLIVLAAVLFGCASLAAGRDAGAGFWFALAVALKLMPVLLLPYLAWTRRWRACAFAAFFSLLFWVALPLVAFGAGGFAKVYAGWGAELARATDPGAKLHHPILISLGKAALHATGHDAGASRAVVAGVWALWLCVGVAGAAASRMTRSRDGFTILTHVSLLILGPAAVSPYLEPYHMVPLLVPAVLLLAAAVDSRQRAWLRLVAATGFLLGLAVMKVPNPWPLRGLFVNAQALILCGTTVLVAWARVAPPASEVQAPAAASRWARLVARLRLAPASPRGASVRTTSP